MSGAAIMKAIDCCAEPWPVQAWGVELDDFETWHCQSCGQIVAPPANRTNGRERPKVVEEGKATTLDSF